MYHTKLLAYNINMSSKKTYSLFNPRIEGSIKTTVRAKTPKRAAKKLYNEMSEYMTNHVDKMHITIRENNNLHNFTIREKKIKNKNSNAVEFAYDIEEIAGFDSKTNKKLIEKDNASQSGGRKKSSSSSSSSDSSSSSSSSSDYDILIPIYPINKFVYYALPYQETTKLSGFTPIEIEKIFMPMFSLPINPIFEINFSLYKL